MKIKALYRKDHMNEKDISSLLSVESTNALRECISNFRKGDVKNSIRLLNDILSSIDSNLLLEYSARFSKLERENHAGILDYDTYTKNRNELIRGISVLLNEYYLNDSKSKEKLRNKFGLIYKESISQRLYGVDSIRLPIKLYDKKTPEIVEDRLIEIDTQHKNICVIAALLEKKKNKILILGEQGAGKTIALLDTAISLISKNANCLPILLSIATWSSRFHSINSWLEIILQNAYGIHIKDLDNLEKCFVVIYFFDGLDELKKGDRISFLEAINFWQKDTVRKHIVSSRKEEYLELEFNTLATYHIEIIRPSKDHLFDEIKKLSVKRPEYFELIDRIEHQRILLSVIEIPFYFNIIQNLIQLGDDSAIKINFETIDNCKQELVKIFINKMLINKLKYGHIQENSLIWLKYISKNLTDLGYSSFDLATIQPNWLNNKLRYVLIYSIIAPTTYLFAILGGSIGNHYDKISIGLLLGLILGIFASITNLLKGKGQIYTGDWLKWKPSLVFENRKIFFRSFFKSLIPISITLGSIIFIMLYLSDFSPINLYVFLMCILIGAIPGSIMSLFIAFLASGAQRTQSFRFSRSTKITDYWSVLNPMFYRHLALRLSLAVENKFPLSLTKFVDDMVSSNILVNVKGRIAFRHSILQSYFYKNEND